MEKKNRIEALGTERCANTKVLYVKKLKKCNECEDGLLTIEYSCNINNSRLGTIESGPD